MIRRGGEGTCENGRPERAGCGGDEEEKRRRDGEGEAEVKEGEGRSHRGSLLDENSPGLDH